MYIYQSIEHTFDVLVYTLCSNLHMQVEVHLVEKQKHEKQAAHYLVEAHLVNKQKHEKLDGS